MCGPVSYVRPNSPIIILRPNLLLDCIGGSFHPALVQNAIPKGTSIATECCFIHSQTASHQLPLACFLRNRVFGAAEARPESAPTCNRSWRSKILLDFPTTLACRRRPRRCRHLHSPLPAHHLPTLPLSLHPKTLFATTRPTTSSPPASYESVASSAIGRA